MSLSFKMGIPLTELMEKTSHRQYRIWEAWLELDRNTPDRTDHYLMQIAAEVRRTIAKNPQGVEIKHMKLEWKDPNIKPKQLPVEVVKSLWMSRVGNNVTLIENGKVKGQISVVPMKALSDPPKTMV